MIEIKNLTKVYKDGSVGVKNINLVLPNKGLIVFEGKSGSGKSTLLNLISGIMRPTEGDIYFNKENIKKIPGYKDDVGMIFQDFNLIADLNVFDNINLTSNSKTKDLVKLLGIEDLMKKNTHEISGGEARRVAIARSLNKGVKVLLCDEPTESLDKDNEDIILNILKKISEDILVIVVSHKEGVLKYADRIITMSKSQIVDDKLIKEDNTTLNINNDKGKLSIKRLFKIAVARILDNLGLFSLNLTTLILVFTLFLGSIVLKSIDLDEQEVKAMLANSEHRLLIDDVSNTTISKSVVNDLGVNYDEVYAYFISGANFSFTLGHLESDIQDIGAFYLGNIGEPEVVKISNHTFLSDDAIVGSIPKEANEVMISEYTFEGFKMFGVKTSSGEYRTYSSVEEVIGETLLLGDKEVKISGVYRQNVKNYEGFKKIQFVKGYAQEVLFSMFCNSITNLNYLYVTDGFDEYIDCRHKGMMHYLVNDDNPEHLLRVRKLDARKFNVKGIYTGNLAKFRNLIKRLNIFGTIIFVIFGIIGIVLISNYFGNSIQNHEKDNRILKYLGLSNFKIFIPYLIEALILVLVAFGFSTLIVGIVCNSLNKFYEGILLCDITLFNMTLKNVGYLAGFVLIIIVILSSFNIFNINKTIKKYTE